LRASLELGASLEFRASLELRGPDNAPCSRPMRKRASVMEKMGWEQKWASTGVKAVIAPHAAVDRSRTFSPPTLCTGKEAQPLQASPCFIALAFP